MGTYNWSAIVEIDYPEIFQQALVKTLPRPRSFKYIYLGGAFTVQDQEKSLWMFETGRKVRVRILENSLAHDPSVMLPLSRSTNEIAMIGSS